MAQQFNYPKSETELRATQDVLYREAKAAYDRGERPSFKGLIEVMSAKVTIVTAIHNIKANKGANTPGVDGVKIRNYLQSREEWVIHDIQSAFTHYVPKFVRRKYIDKPGKKEKRPLGIPTIRALLWIPSDARYKDGPGENRWDGTPKWMALDCGR